jgi:hypothetical protein
MDAVKLKNRWYDERLDSPEFNHRHPIRRRAAGLGIISQSERRGIDAEKAQPGLSTRQWDELRKWHDTGEWPDDETIREIEMFMIQQLAVQRNSDAYSIMAQQSQISIQQALDALRRYRKNGVQGRNRDGDTYTSGGGPAAGMSPQYSGAD